MADKANKFNTLAVGVLSGIILPVIVYFILYHTRLQNVRATIFSNNLIIGNIIPLLISHCILPNLVIFFIFININWNRAAKGILISTVALTVALFAIKLIFSTI